MEKKTTNVSSSTSNSIWMLSSMIIALFAFLVRVLVSLHPYSGAGNPPMYGDFEAQRHWMEITLHTSSKDWYQNTTSNNLSYWGLDYPPLTAYQSYAHGLLFLQPFAPDSVALFTSRGHESPLGKLLMRWTVLSSDTLIFFPAALYFIVVYYIRRGEKDTAWQLAMILLNPCLIIIDHGHFQYNCISLGLTLAAAAAIFSKNELIASVLFSLALNHKQMSAYFAPAFFSHLLGKSLRRQNPLLEVLKLGLVVLGTFALVWSPFLYSKEAVIQGQIWFSLVRAVMQVLSRLAPFERGIYEDYVANFWCSTSILIKWKRLFTTVSLKLLSFSATFISVLPSMIQQIRDPSNNSFLYALLNSSFSFYLFSFQVHEKSILLPLLPASLLALEEPLLFRWLTYYAMLSMLPLLYRDHLILPYVALLALFAFTHYSPYRRCNKGGIDSSVLQKVLMTSSLLCSLVLHIIYLTLQPPKKYPFLFEALIMILCFSQFVIITIYANRKQWMLLDCSMELEKAKKTL